MTNKIILLDGGLGQEIQKRSGRPATPLWSIEVMREQPDLVTQVHQDFAEAGARILTINNYTATRSRLRRNKSDYKVEDLQAMARDILISARDQAVVSHKIRLAGSLPPLHASYHPDEQPDYESDLKDYQELVAMQSSFVDLIICETMSSISEAKAAATAACSSGKPVWCALSVMDEPAETPDKVRLRSGELLSDALTALSHLPLAGLLLNCSRPEAISIGLPLLIETGIPAGAYANGFTSIASLLPGTSVESLSARTDLGPDEYADIALSWVEQGAAIVGGCCEVSPAHIAALHDRLIVQGYELTSEL